MILPELTEDDKKFIDENIHTLMPNAIVSIALHAKLNNISMRDADKQVQDWYEQQIIPVIDAHLEKHKPVSATARPNIKDCLVS